MTGKTATVVGLVLIAVIGGIFAWVFAGRPGVQEQISMLCADSAQARMGLDVSAELPDGHLDGIQKLPEEAGEPDRFLLQSEIAFTTNRRSRISTGVRCQVRAEGILTKVTLEELEIGNQFR